MISIAKLLRRAGLDKNNRYVFVNSSFGIVITLVFPFYYGMKIAGAFFATYAFYLMLQSLVSMKSGEVFFRVVKYKSDTRVARGFILLTTILYVLLAFSSFSFDNIFNYEQLDAELLLLAAYLPLGKQLNTIVFYAILSGWAQFSVSRLTQIIFLKYSIAVVCIISSNVSVFNVIGILEILFTCFIVLFMDGYASLSLKKNIKLLRDEKNLVIGGFFKVFQSNKESYFLSFIAPLEIVSSVRLLKLPYSLTAIYIDSFLGTLLKQKNIIDSRKYIAGIIKKNSLLLAIGNVVVASLLFTYILKEMPSGISFIDLSQILITILTVSFIHIFGDWWYRYYTILISPRRSLVFLAVSFLILFFSYCVALKIGYIYYFWGMALAYFVRLVLFKWGLDHETKSYCGSR